MEKTKCPECGELVYGRYTDILNHVSIVHAKDSSEIKTRARKMIPGSERDKQDALIFEMTNNVILKNMRVQKDDLQNSNPKLIPNEYDIQKSFIMLLNNKKDYRVTPRNDGKLAIIRIK